MTVLFADVVRSMDIATAVGAERLREIMAELFERSTAVVHALRRHASASSPATGSWPSSGHQLRWRTMPFAHAWPPWTSRRRLELAADVQRCDGITLQLRIGLNSGQVIAGEIGSSAGGYTTIGEQVGMAQRMESIAPPGGVMLGESTARLVENTVVLGEPELVHVKGQPTGGTGTPIAGSRPGGIRVVEVSRSSSGAPGSSTL